MKLHSYLKVRLAELPFPIDVLPDILVCGVHHGDQYVDKQDADDPLVHCPEAKAHGM